MKAPIAPKQPYKAPTVINLGKVTDLTKGTPLIPTADVAAISK